MNYEIRRTQEGTVIHVDRADVAVAVYTDGEERIYLPDAGRDTGTHYRSSTRQVDASDGSLAVFHPGHPDTINFIY
jgi:hypothetical protein